MKTFLTIALSSIFAFTAGYFVATMNQTVSISQPASTAKNTGKQKNKSELNKANKQIANLKDINQSLANQVENLNLPIPASTTFPELLDKIDALPTAFINMQLAQIFDEEYLKQIKDPHQFAKELAEVALTEDNPENSNGLASITFSRSPITGIRLLGPSFETAPFDSIFAHIAPNIKLKNCIVKWRYLDSDNLMMFKQMSLDPDIQTQHVHMKPATGWKVGSYQVTVHDMDNNQQLIGSSRYQITNIIDRDKTENSPDLEVINDLILNGQAVSKSQ